MGTQKQKSKKKSPAESKATASEPRIQIAPDVRDPKDPDPRQTLPDIDPRMAVVEDDGFAHDTIPAPPLALEEEEEEPDTQET